jgi:hypothetical protein
MKILGLSPSFFFLLIIVLILIGIVSSFIRAYAYKTMGVRPIQTGSLINVAV